MMTNPPLKMLHSDDTLNRIKLDKFNKLTDEELMGSLKPGQDGALKARSDGTVLEGHHRLKILRERGIDIDALPREVIAKDPPAT